MLIRPATVVFFSPSPGGQQREGGGASSVYHQTIIDQVLPALYHVIRTAPCLPLPPSLSLPPALHPALP